MSAPNPHVNDQIRAADPALSVFVTANAGSGKTSTLVNRVARLLLEGVPPADILCVTYTKAAAAEMQSRLFETLGSWAVIERDKLLDELVKIDPAYRTRFNEETAREAQKLFVRALETPGGLKIQTIHAFCEKLLRRFPVEAGVSPRFTVLESEAAAELSREARRDLAQAAADDPDGPIGRAYARYAVDLSWPAFESLLSLLEQKRQELSAYVEAAEAGEAPDPWALTGAEPGQTPEDVARGFLSMIDPLGWLAAADGFSTGSANDQKLAAQMKEVDLGGHSLEPVQRIFFKADGAPREKFGTKSAPVVSENFLAGLQPHFEAALEAARAARTAVDTLEVLTLARAHAGLYEAAKARTGALDFTDLVHKALALLTQAEARRWVLFKLDGGIEHVLIDEAQDTAPEQWDMVRALTDDFFAGEGAERWRGKPGAQKPAIARTMFAVGDEKQSIYSFQGARPERLRQEGEVYLDKARIAVRPFAGVFLKVSFRSTRAVLDFVDKVFAGPERTRALVGPQGDWSDHVANREDHPGAVDLWPLFEDPVVEERDAWDPVDQESVASGRKQLARALAEDIRRQVEAGTAVHDPKLKAYRPCGYGDFLVLVRRRDPTFEEIIRALKTAGVPVAGADRLKLSEHIVFDDLKALARFVLYPSDDLSLAEVLRGPLCDVPDFDGADSLFQLAEKTNRNGSLWGALQRRAGEQPAWGRARDLLEFAIGTRGRDPFGFFSGVLNRVDDTGRSGRARFLARLGREAVEAVDESLNQVLAAEGRGGTDLETALALLELSDVQVKRELEGPRGEVRVMTVHGAKGLEAPVVILPDTTMRAKPQGPTLIPSADDDGGQGPGWLMAPGSSKQDCAATAAARELRQRRTDEESLRLLYVALTRARDRLIIMGRRDGRSKVGYEAGSWWEVLSAAFADPAAGAREIGDGRQRIGDDPKVLGRAAVTSVEAPSAPDWARRSTSVEAGARIASPSQMDETLRIPAPSPLDRTPGSLGRFRRGDLIHLLLERLPELSADQWDEAGQRLLSRERDLTPEQREEMVGAALGVLCDARFAPVFGPGSRPEVALVGSAEGLPGGVSISGRIDRLVITPERVLVVDFKTNRPAPDRIEDADPAYVLQLAVYVSVLGRIYPDRPVEAALVWTDGPKLTPVPGEMMEQALLDARSGAG